MTTNRTTSMRLAPLWVLVAACLIGACTDGEPSTPPAAPTPDAAAPSPGFGDVDLYDVRVMVTFTGPVDGALNVGAFSSFPPMGPPLANSRDETPRSPSEFTLRDLEPGTYVLIGIMDSDPPSPTLPGEEDVVCHSEPFEVTDEDLTLSLDFGEP